MLVFDEASHTYHWNGIRVPSVTQILGAMTDLSGIPGARLEFARDRGHAVHYACELFDQDDLDWSTLDPRLVPYVEGWADFRAKTGFIPTGIEEKVFHPGLRYAGTLDRRGVIDGQPSVLDIKAVAKMYPTTGMQTAAYAEALNAGTPGIEKHTGRYGIQLLPSGKWKLNHYSEVTDWPTFVSALTLINWANKNKQRIEYVPQ